MYWLNESSRYFLSKDYLTDGQSPEERIREIADKAEEYLGIKGFSDKFYDYMGRGFYSLSSPVWSNYGNSRGLPISCFGSYVADDMAGIMKAAGEVGMMSKYGGGTSAYFGDLRGRGDEIKGNGKSSGAVHFMQLFDSVVNVVSQGSVRRGRLSPYLPIDHKDIMEFLDIATEGNPIQDLNHAVVVPEGWMESMIGGDEEKRKVWAKVIQRRSEIGYPYILFQDNANAGRPDVYKDENLRILASNLCSEIMLPSNEEESFVCCLSSMNLARWDEWKDTDAVETMVFFLDTVIDDFLSKLEAKRGGDSRDQEAFRHMERTYQFAKNHRALGLGVLGWHSFLQAKGIPFESEEARKINVEIFKTMKARGYAASSDLAALRGPCALTEGYDRRNTTLFAIAPTTSSSFILGQVSQSIEPIWSNCYVKDTAKMKVVIKNPELEKVLETYGKNVKEVWDSIRNSDGSVQHLDFLSEREKAVFRTFAEISPMAVIEQAADRQLYIDQGQSLNLMLPPSIPVREINELYINAWKMGLKSLYYQHSMNAAQELTRMKISSLAV